MAGYCLIKEQKNCVFVNVYFIKWDFDFERYLMEHKRLNSLHLLWNSVLQTWLQPRSSVEKCIQPISGRERTGAVGVFSVDTDSFVVFINTTKLSVSTLNTILLTNILSCSST